MEMLNLSRRAFLGGVLAATGAAAIPGRSLAMVPTIYADGYHDDTAGLQAALRGEPFRCERTGLAISHGGVLYLTEGVFMLSDTIAPTERVPVLSHRNYYNFSNARRELECGLDITSAKNSVFVNDHFDGSGKTKWGILDRRPPQGGFRSGNFLGSYLEHS